MTEQYTSEASNRSVEDSSSELIFMVSPFREPESQRGLYFCFFTVIYVAIVSGNSLLLAAIIRERSLHKPMFVLLAHLVLCDLAGSTATLPGILRNIVTADRVPFAACVAQMYVAHIYGGLAGLVLCSMAVDRTLAICWPLRYPSLMSNARAMAVNCAVAAFVAILMLGFVGLTATLKLCGPCIMTMPHCDHLAIVGMACGDVSLNYLYDLMVKSSLLIINISVVLLSYCVILFQCRKSSLRRNQRKAIQTCVTHLIVFLILEVSVLLLIMQNHIQNYFGNSEYLPVYLVINFHAIPPLINPIVYGLRTAEIRHSVRRLFSTKVLPSGD